VGLEPQILHIECLLGYHLDASLLLFTHSLSLS